MESKFSFFYVATLIFLCVSLFYVLFPKIVYAQQCAGGATERIAQFNCVPYTGCVVYYVNRTFNCFGTPPLCSRLTPVIGASCFSISDVNCSINNTVTYGWTGSGCFVTTPNCNTGVVCNSCSYAFNTCYAGNGTGTNCRYTAHTGGGACNQVGAPNQARWCSANNCTGGYWCSGGTCITYCNQGKVNCGVCSGFEAPNSCGTAAGTQTCTHNAPQLCQNSNFTSGCNFNYNNCYANYVCTNGNSCQTNIYAHVRIDYNHNGTADAPKAGVNVSDGFVTQATDGNGDTTFGGLTTGNYTIRETVPANFQATNATAQGVALTNNAGNQNVTFLITPLYTISGRVFNDLNKDQKYNGSDTGVGGVTVSVSGGPTAVGNMTTAADGTWTTPTNLESGTYTVTYASALPAGYHFTTPSSFAVTVGDPAGTPKCNTGGSLDAACGGTNNGSISNLDLGRTNETPWNQSMCFDVRNDSGLYSNPIPAAPSCGGVSGAYDSVTNGSCSTGAGIIFTCNATPSFGLGVANANNWQAGGTAANQQECFVGAGLNVIRTSYNYLLTTARESNITPIDMATVCGAGGLANCTLPATLAKGVYLANGSVTINAFTFPVDPTTPQGFIFLINGDLHILGNIIVPAGSVAAFSTSGSIYVDPTVGNTITTANDPANNNPNIEGLYSADASFVVQSAGSGTNICNLNGTPLDKKLNVIGSIVTNAGQGGGSFTDNRDLCIYDTACPSTSVGDGAPGTVVPVGGGTNTGLALSYWLTLYADAKFLNHQVFNWQELRP